MVRYSTNTHIPDGALIHSAKEFSEIMDRESGEASISVRDISNTQYWQERYSGDSPKGLRTETNPVGNHLLSLLAENALQSEQITILQNMVRARDVRDDGLRTHHDRELFSWMDSLRETLLNTGWTRTSPPGEPNETLASRECASEIDQMDAEELEKRIATNRKPLSL